MTSTAINYFTIRKKRKVIHIYYKMDAQDVLKMDEQNIFAQSVHTDVMNLLEAEPSGDHAIAQREMLAVIVSAGKTKDTIGVHLTHERVNTLSDKEVEKYIKRYEAHVGSKITESLIDTFIFLITKTVGMVIKVKNMEDYHKEHKNDYIINHELSNLAGNLASKCGQFVAAADFVLVSTKNVGFDSFERKEEVAQQSSPTADKEVTQQSSLTAE